MLERWVEAVRPLVSGERALEAVRALARHHRIQASPGYDDAAAWLAAELSRERLAVAVDLVPGDGRTAYLGCTMPEGWACEHARAAVLGAVAEPVADFGAAPLSIVQRSAPGAGRFALVALADGSRPEDYAGLDVRGRAVLTDGPVQRVHQLAVVERGAAGLVSFGRRLLPPVRTRDHDRDSLAYTSFWWAGDAPRGWGVVATPARGEALAERLAHGEALELEVDIRTRRFVTTIPLVSAALPGALPGEVLLTSHLCHPRPGANDNASGVAATLEAVRALRALEAAGGLPGPRRTIRALWMPEFTGTYAWLGLDPARRGATVAALNLDMVGEDQVACGSEQLLERAPHFAGSFADELVRLARRATWDPADGALRAREVPYSGGSDHAVWLDPGLGVPCPLLIQWPDRWYHSSLDSPERCDPRSLAHAARIGAVYAAWIATAREGDAARLAERIERAAVREMRAALDGERAEARVRAARWRGQRSLASLARLAPGAAPDAVQRAVAEGAEAIEGAFETEIAPVLPGAARAAAPGPCARVPFRLRGALPPPVRELQAGRAALDAGALARLQAIERDLGGGPALDLAWFACDGRRTVGEIAACLSDEGSDVDAATLEGYFDLLAGLGAAAWRAG